MTVSRVHRQRNLQKYTALAKENAPNTPDWHYWMQYVDHWRRINQRER